MMSKFENPIQFDTKKKIRGIEITYSNLMEISQGGPEIGNLSVNGRMVGGLYGGPAIYKDDYVYLPAYVKKFLGTGFKLARIKIKTLEVEHFGDIKQMIFLDKIEDDLIYFFEDISKTILGHYKI
jgi:hypothetical protein